MRGLQAIGPGGAARRSMTREPPTQVGAVVTQRDPERTRQIARTTAERRLVEVHRSAAGAARTATAHQIQALHGLQRSDEDRRRVIHRFGDGVDQIVHPVVQIHIRAPG